MTKLDALMEGYIAYKTDVVRLAPGTIRDLRCTLKRASLAMSKIVPDTPLWRCCLEDFLIWIEGEREAGTSELSLNKFITHCRGFLDYAWRSKRVDMNVLDGFQLQMSKGPVKPKSITEAEAQQLIQSLSSQTFINRRDRVVVLPRWSPDATRQLCLARIAALKHIQSDNSQPKTVLIDCIITQTDKL